MRLSRATPAIRLRRIAASAAGGCAMTDDDCDTVSKAGIWEMLLYSRFRNLKVTSRNDNSKGFLTFYEVDNNPR
jgi:hypothetical protein